MIITKEVEIVLTSQSSIYYENKGYLIPRYFNKRHNKWKFKRGITITVKVIDLSLGSPAKVLCKCDVCGKERWLKYFQYHPLCNSCANKTETHRKQSSNFFKGKPKTKEHLNKVRQSLIKLGYWKTEKERTKFKNYYLKVIYETKKNIKELFNNWNGTDYYTGEKLLTDISKSNDRMYRTIDHKISIKYGFENDIDPKEIGQLKNLCICSRSTNSKKRTKDYKTFMSYSL